MSLNERCLSGDDVSFGLGVMGVITRLHDYEFRSHEFKHVGIGVLSGLVVDVDEGGWEVDHRSIRGGQFATKNATEVGGDPSLMLRMGGSSRHHGLAERRRDDFKQFGCGRPIDCDVVLIDLHFLIIRTRDFAVLIVTAARPNAGSANSQTRTRARQCPGPKARASWRLLFAGV